MFRILTICLFFLFAGQQLYADVLVRMEVQQEPFISNVDIRLFEEEAPFTVANFLNYVNDGDYTNSFIHRSTDVAISVIQGGGFTFDPALNDGTFSVGTGGLEEVPADPPVQNEFSLSNVRGTIAMAKQAGDENSATSQWFINVIDNSASLDVLEGGYTVFGEVLSNGMTVVDQIAGQSTFDRRDIHPAFADLPLINYTADPILQPNLVRTSSVTPLLSISSDIDFRTVLINTSAQSVITIRNLDTVAHSIGDIATTDTVAAPFSIITTTTNPCPNTSLNQGEQCTLEIQFSPLTENVFNDTFNIELTDVDLGHSYRFAMMGEGVLTPQNITLSLDTIEFEDSLLLDLIFGFPDQIVITVINDGEVDLNIISVTLGGADAADFELIDNCTSFSPVVPAGSCLMGVNFKPLTTGDKSATLTLVSDDPDEGVLVLPITGTASTDTDGIPESVEDAGYNDGDGNNDGIPDSIQNHVASFPATNGAYITLLVTPGARINDLSVLSEDQVGTPPDNIRFNLGLLDFRIDGLFPGDAVEVGFIVPPGYVPSSYYMYGPTPDNINPHWYEFMFDGTTGAAFLGNAIITSPDGRNIERNLIRVIFEDGERGDADLTANGVIVDPGAPVVALAEADSGSLSILMLFLPVIGFLLRSVTNGLSCRLYTPQDK